MDTLGTLEAENYDNVVNIYDITNVHVPLQKLNAIQNAPKSTATQRNGCYCGYRKRCCRGCGSQIHPTWTCPGYTSEEKICDNFKPIKDDEWNIIVTKAYNTHLKFDHKAQRGEIVRENSPIKQIKNYPSNILTQEKITITADTGAGNSVGNKTILPYLSDIQLQSKKSYEVANGDLIYSSGTTGHLHGISNNSPFTIPDSSRR